VNVNTSHGVEPGEPAELRGTRYAGPGAFPRLALSALCAGCCIVLLAAGFLPTRPSRRPEPGGVIGGGPALRHRPTLDKLVSQG